MGIGTLWIIFWVGFPEVPINDFFKKLPQKISKIFWSKIFEILFFQNCWKLNSLWKICKNQVCITLRSKVMAVSISSKICQNFRESIICFKKWRFWNGHNFCTERDTNLVFTYFPQRIQFPTILEKQNFQNFGPKIF